MAPGEDAGLSRRRFLARCGVAATAATGVGSVPATAQSSNGTNWVMHRHDTGNTASGSGVTPTDSIRERWQFDVGANSLSAATVVDGTVYVGSGDNSVYALDAATGDERWSVTTDNSIRSTPAVVDGTVYVGGDDGSVYALSAATGNERWRAQLGLPIPASPTPVDGSVYVGGRDGRMYALDAATGEERWSFTTNDPIYGSPVVVDGIVYVVNRSGATFALDAEDGRRYWETTLEAGVYSPPVVADGTLYVASVNNRLIALTTRFGEQRWATSVPIEESTSMAVTDSIVAVSGSGGVLYVLDPDTGTERYQFDAGFRCFSPVVVGDVLCLGTAVGVRAIDPETSAQQWTRTLGSNAQPALSVANGVVYAAAQNGTLHAIVGEETPTPGDDSSGTATATETETATETATATPTAAPTDGQSGTRRTSTATPVPPTETDTATPVTDSETPATPLLSTENPLFFAGVGGAVIGSLLLGGYLWGRSDLGTDAGGTASSTDGSDPGGGSDTDARGGTDADATPDADPDELVEEATRALEEGERARDRNEYGRAATRLEDAVDGFTTALSAVDDDARAAGIRDDLEAAEAALLSVDSARQALDDVRDLLATAEADMENAVVAFVNDQQTVARVRFRQARDRYERAIDTLDEAGIEQLDLEVAVSTDDALDTVDAFDSIPGVDEAAIDALRDAGYDTPTDLPGMSVEELASTAGVDDETAARLTVASWQTPSGQRRFGSVDDVAERLEAATLGYRSC